MTVLGFEEEQIMERTGHRSSTVRTYKRQSAQQLHEVSRALDTSEIHEAAWGCREGKRNNPGDERFKGEKQRDFRVRKRWRGNMQIPMSEKIIHFFVIFENKNNVL